MRGFFSVWCLLNSFYYIQCCNSFGDITVELLPKNGDAYNLNVHGCVDPTTVSRNTTEVTVKGEFVPMLKFGAVQNLVNVKKVAFLDCSTEVIEAGAFRHLPRLEEVVINSSHLDLVPRRVFSDLPSLTAIKLNANEIKVLEDQAFAHIPKLKWLSVAGNKIATWRSTWFTNSTAIEQLDFQDNIIWKIPASAFKNLKKLARVLLDSNEISVIEPGAFQGLRHLEFLGLKHNLLKTIEPDIFPDQLTVDVLEIGANRLNFLTNEVLDKISVREVSLEGNPWTCPCLERVLFWINQKNGTVTNSTFCQQSDIPRCVFPLIDSRTCLETVDEEVTQVYLNQVRAAAKGLKAFVWEKCVRLD